MHSSNYPEPDTAHWPSCSDGPSAAAITQEKKKEKKKEIKKKEKNPQNHCLVVCREWIWESASARALHESLCGSVPCFDKLSL